MEAERFDRLSRALFTIFSRRGLLTGCVSGLLALCPLNLAIEDAAARKKRRKKKKKKKCKGGKKKCGKTCIPKTSCCTDASCGGCETCQNGACVSGCQSGQACQDDQCNCTAESCADGCCEGTICLTDARECDGECIPQDDCCVDGDCPDDATCEDGVCVCSVADEAVCGESCVNLATDGANCGVCGNACPTGNCFHGACSCTNAQSDCPEGCACGGRAEGGGACFASGSGLDCTVDDDCPLGSVCLVNDSCSISCLE